MKLLVLVALVLGINAQAMTFSNKKVLSAQSMGASFTSAGIDVSQQITASFQAVWSGGGSPVGTFTLEVSNDNVSPSTTSDEAANVVNWTTFSGSSTAISGDGDLAYSVSNIGYRWVRIRYARTSGTGTVNIEAAMKREQLK